MNPTVNNYMDRIMDALFDALSSVFGLTNAQAEEVIRYDWPNGESVKFDATPTDDRCYIRLTEIEKPATGYINTAYFETNNRMIAKHSMHICLRADAVIYGPHAFDYAHRYVMGLFTHDIRASLRKAGIAPIAGAEMPTHNPEIKDGIWYDRYDVGMDLYALVAYEHDVPAAASAPAIMIQKG